MGQNEQGTFRQNGLLLMKDAIIFLLRLIEWLAVAGLVIGTTWIHGFFTGARFIL